MNTINRRKFLLVLYFITAAFCAIEIAFSYQMYFDATREIANVSIGLQIIILFSLIPSVSATVCGVKKPLLPLMIINVVNTLIYFIMDILIFLEIVETSQMWKVMILLNCKIILFVLLSVVMYIFFKNLVKKKHKEVIDMENEYAFRRFGKYLSLFALWIKELYFLIFTTELCIYSVSQTKIRNSFHL